MSRRRLHWPAIFGLFAFVAILLYPFTLLARVFYWGDMFLYFYPMEEHVRQVLESGKLPLWNPHVYCGQPLIGNPQSWLFYPTSALLLWLPVSVYFSVNGVLHVALAGAGGYLFFRRISHDGLGAFLGACAYCGSGYVIARLQFPNMVQAMAFLPWLLLLVDRTIAKPDVGIVGFTSLVVTLSIISAHAQITYLTIAAAIAYAAARLTQARRNGLRVKRAATCLCTALAVGVAASAAQLLPAVQLFGHSTREQLRFFEATRFTLEPPQLINFIAPRYFGHPTSGDFWGTGNHWESSVYVGLVPILLSIVVIVKKPARPAVVFFALLGLVSLLLAMGQWGGLYWVAYYLVPGISSFHDPARFAFLTVFSIAALASLGLRVLKEAGIPRYACAAIVALTLIDLVSYSSTLNPSIAPEAIRQIGTSTLTGSSRTYSYGQKDLWEHLVNYADYGPQTSAYLALLAASMAPNSLMSLGAAEAGGYEPIPVRHITEIDKAVRESIRTRERLSHRMYSMMNVGTIAVPADLRFAEGSGVPSPAWRMLQSRHPGPAMWFVDAVHQVKGPGESLGAIADSGFDPFRTAYVEGPSHRIPNVHPSESDAPLRVSQDGLTAQFDPGSYARLLIRSATYYPGWEANVNRQSVPVIRANHAFQAALIPAGADSITFTYRPQVLQFGLYVSLISLLLMSAMVTAGYIARRRQSG